jgi:hypothetical protein
MRLIATLFPDAFPYHPNWRAGRTHRAIAARSPAIDHVGARLARRQFGGSESRHRVLPLQPIRADFGLDQLGWEMQVIPATAWDGLTRYYADL